MGDGPSRNLVLLLGVVAVVLGVGSLLIRGHGRKSRRAEAGSMFVALLGFGALCLGVILWLQ